MHEGGASEVHLHGGPATQRSALDIPWQHERYWRGLQVKQFFDVGKYEMSDVLNHFWIYNKISSSTQTNLHENPIELVSESESGNTQSFLIFISCVIHI